MEIKTITYKRVHNLGNYNTEHLEMFVELTSDDDVDHCATGLKNHVETALGIVKPEPVPAPKPVSTNYDKNPF